MKDVWEHYKAKRTSAAAHFAFGMLAVFLGLSITHSPIWSLAIGILLGFAWEWGAYTVMRRRDWMPQILDLVPFIVGALAGYWWIH